ncbi:MAG: molybdopterin-synthase adenylyltransferase MoeB [Planctomycetota bacterium]
MDSREIVQGLRERVPTVSPGEAHELAAAGAALVDVRESGEVLEGTAEGALSLPRGWLELRAEQALPDQERPVVVFCAAGVRSLFAAEALQRLGYRDVRSMAGGYAAWKEAGLPTSVGSLLTAEEHRRYARHLTIPEVGEEGQSKLRRARVLIVGAGGLGSPAAIYLACAGVGTLGVVDFDVVEESNLQRQPLHDTTRIGMRKVDSARHTLERLNPHVELRTFDERLTSQNVDRILPDFDVALDGADNFPTRYLLNDACVKHGKPDVHGSVFRFEGHASVFVPGRGPCYRCLFPEPPPPEMAPSCAEAGVLGVLPGVVGLIQAIEAIKLVLGEGDLLVGRLVIYDALAGSFREVKVRRNPDCAVCADGKPFPGYIDYEHFCAGA